MNGIITIQSEYSVRETVDRMAGMAAAKGMTVFARIDHAANAAQVLLSLRPTELIVFGNPRAGTFLMQDQQLCGIDLPLKVLSWEDDSGKVWISYNDLQWISDRYDLTDKSKPALLAIGEVMAVLSRDAAKK